MSRLNSEEEMKSLLSKRVDQGMQLAHSAAWEPLVSSSNDLWKQKHGVDMDDMRKSILAFSLENYARQLKSEKVSPEAIRSASENPGDVSNPISMMFALISIIVPNLAYMDVAAVQPQPTEKSPLYYLSLVANTARNGIAQGASLLGGFSYETNNQYTSNRYKGFPVTVTTGASQSYSVTTGYNTLLPNTIVLTFHTVVGGVATVYTAIDNGVDALTGGAWLLASSIDYDHGIINFTIDNTSAVTDTLSVDFRYSMTGLDPVQVLFEFESEEIVSYPRELSTSYDLLNYYAAKQVLKIDIDELMGSAVGGFINKEISSGVLDNIGDAASDSFSFSKSIVSPDNYAFHRLGILEPIIQASNKIRKNIARGAGNVLIAGTDMINLIESFGDTLATKEKYDREPIGPYVWGSLKTKDMKIIKNQDYADDFSAMAFKANDAEASWGVGVFIGLFSTTPLQKETLKVVNGVGTQIGEVQMFPDSIAEIVIS
jgi:hypothetical protein